MTRDEHDDDAKQVEKVAETLARVRAGVRQRHGVLATMPEDAQHLLDSLEGVRAGQRLQAPVPSTHRGVIGLPIVWAKSLVYHLFMKWYLGPLVDQQNAFNRATALALQALGERQLDLARSVAREHTTER